MRYWQLRRIRPPPAAAGKPFGADTQWARYDPPGRNDLASGDGGNVRSFNGTNNVYLSNVIPATTSGTTMFYAGDFNAGIVAARRKDIEIRFSDEVLFSSYGVQGRAVQRCWWNMHGINNTANGSQVIACTL